MKENVILITDPWLLKRTRFFQSFLDVTGLSIYYGRYSKISFWLWCHYGHHLDRNWCMSVSSGSEVLCKSFSHFKLFNYYLKLNTLHRRPGQGRRRSTSHVQDRSVHLSALKHRFSVARELQNQLFRATETRTSYQTDFNRHHEYRLRSRQPYQLCKLDLQHVTEWADYSLPGDTDVGS